MKTFDGQPLEVEGTFETTPSVLYDAVAVLDGKDAAKALANIGQALEFLKDQYRHAKPIFALGAGVDLLERAALPLTLPTGNPDPGMLIGRKGTVAKELPAFVAAIARHRHHARETDPPRV